jgi:hypothetical protein
VRPPRDDLPFFPERRPNESADNLNSCAIGSCDSKLVYIEEERWFSDKSVWLAILGCRECDGMWLEEIPLEVHNEFNRGQQEIRKQIEASADGLALSVQLSEIDIFYGALKAGAITPEDF